MKTTINLGRARSTDAGIPARGVALGTDMISYGRGQRDYTAPPHRRQSTSTNDRRSRSSDAEPDVSVSADGAYTELDHARMAERHFDAAQEANAVGNTELRDEHEHASYLHDRAADAIAADHEDMLHASHRAAQKSRRMHNLGIRWD